MQEDNGIKIYKHVHKYAYKIVQVVIPILCFIFNFS